MEEVPVSDVIRVLCNRQDVIGVLRTNPATKPDLVSSMDVSRSTVDRAIATLESFNLVARCEDGYSLTNLGRLLANLHCRYERSITSIFQARTLTSMLPSGESGETVVFDGAEITLPEKHDPDRPLRQNLERIDQTEYLRTATPVVLDQRVSAYRNRVLNHGMEMELVVTRPVLDCLRSAHAKKLADLVRHDSFTLLRTAGDLPFGFSIFDRGKTDELGLMLHDDNGAHGFVRNDGRSAVGWGERLYHEYVEDSVSVDEDAVVLNG